MEQNTILSTIDKSLPQGSVLSLFLFAFVFADFFKILIPRVKCLLYAVDVFTYYVHDFLQIVETLVQNILRHVLQWCQCTKMQIHSDK